MNMRMCQQEIVTTVTMLYTISVQKKLGRPKGSKTKVRQQPRGQSYSDVKVNYVSVHYLIYIVNTRACA